MSTVEKSDRREQDQGQKCQSGPSAKDSVIFSGGDSSKNYGADQQRLQQRLLQINRDQTSNLCLFSDQDFSHLKKLSQRFQRLILARSQIFCVIFPKMNCSSKSQT